LAKFGAKNSLYSVVGSLMFVAPEVMDTTIPYSYNADIFSFGVILYKYMTGRERTMYLDLLTNPKAPKEILQELKKNHSEKLAKLVTSMLSIEPDNRPSAKQIVLLLEKERETQSTPIAEDQNNENEKHYFITCDECLTSPIVGIRYKCRTCFDYNLCQNCYKSISNANTHPHAFKLVLKSKFELDEDNVIYEEISCDGCKTIPICGSRYQCQHCFAFDFCGKCYTELRKGHDSSHRFVDITKQKLHNKVAELKSLQKWEKIKELCENSIGNTKDDWISISYLGEALLMLKKQKLATKMFSHILEQEEIGESILVAKGLAHKFQNNISSAMEYFHKSEASEISLNQLGEFYYYGNNCEKNVNKGVQFWRRAAKKGNPSARYNMGVYSSESGDEKRAFSYFKECAFNGNSLGMYQLARCYNKGIGGPQNTEKGEHWLKKALDTGLKDPNVLNI
jgi:tetratricopeptide (TPR) repeat protein